MTVSDLIEELKLFEFGPDGMSKQINFKISKVKQQRLQESSFIKLPDIDLETTLGSRMQELTIEIIDRI